MREPGDDDLPLVLQVVVYKYRNSGAIPDAWQWAVILEADKRGILQEMYDAWLLEDA